MNAAALREHLARLDRRRRTEDGTCTRRGHRPRVHGTPAATATCPTLTIPRIKHAPREHRIGRSAHRSSQIDTDQRLPRGHFLPICGDLRRSVGDSPRSSLPRVRRFPSSSLRARRALREDLQTGAPSRSPALLFYRRDRSARREEGGRDFILLSSVFGPPSPFAPLRLR